MDINEALQFADQWRNKREAPCGDALVTLAAEVRRLQAPAADLVKSTEWETLSSIGNRLHNLSVELNYAGNEALSDELGQFASLLWFWEKREQAPAVEVVPFGYASTDLDGVPNKDGDDLIVKDAPFYCSDDQDCIPLYKHPPAKVEAVPVAWARADLLPLATDRYTPCILTPTKCVSTPVPLYTHPPSLDVCNMEYMGNSVGHIYQKMEAYRYQLGQVKTLDDDTRKMVLELCDIITRAGINDFETALAKQIIKKLGAGE